MPLGFIDLPIIFLSLPTHCTKWTRTKPRCLILYHNLTCNTHCRIWGVVLGGGGACALIFGRCLQLRPLNFPRQSLKVLSRGIFYLVTVTRPDRCQFRVVAKLFSTLDKVWGYEIRRKAQCILSKLNRHTYPSERLFEIVVWRWGGRWWREVLSTCSWHVISRSICKLCSVKQIWNRIVAEINRMASYTLHTWTWTCHQLYFCTTSLTSLLLSDHHFNELTFLCVSSLLVAAISAIIIF